MFVFRMKLLRRPAHQLAKLLWNAWWIPAGHLFQDRNLAITLDKMSWNIELRQTVECFAWHRAGNDIAADHQALHTCMTNVFEHCLKRGQIPVNVIDRPDPHNHALGDRINLTSYLTSPRS